MPREVCKFCIYLYCARKNICFDGFTKSYMLGSNIFYKNPFSAWQISGYDRRNLSLLLCSVLLFSFRLSDQQDSTSNESFQSQMCLWFKLFLRSIVPFGDEAKKAVKTVFKYFSCLKGKLTVPIEAGAVSGDVSPTILFCYSNCKVAICMKSSRIFIPKNLKREY